MLVFVLLDFFLIFLFLLMLRIGIFFFLLSSLLIVFLLFDDFFDVFFTDFDPLKVIINVFNHFDWLSDLHFCLDSLCQFLNCGSTCSFEYELS